MDSLPSNETQAVDLGPSPDTTSSPAIELLKLLDRDGRHNLVAIHPVTGVVTGRTFPPRAWAEIDAWIRKRNGKENLYFSVNEPRPDAPNKKLTKDDIGAIRAVFADLDPEAGAPLEDARDAIKATAEEALRSCRPAVIVDSGGGFNFYWPLEEKLDAAEYRASVEAQGRGIAKLLGGDAVQNVDRILRLPGTVNIPDAKKRARGRTEAPALLVRSKPDRFTLEGLAQVYAPASEEGVEDRNAEIAEIQRELDMRFVSGFIRIDDLPDDLQQRFAKARRRNPALDALWRGEKPPKDTTGSGWRFALAGLLKYEGGFTPDEFGALCYVWEKVDPDKLTARVIARDWVNAPGEAPDPDAYLEDLPPEPEREETTETFRVLTVADLRARPPAEWLIERHIPKQSVGFLYSRPGAGKSFLALDMSLHIATGQTQWHDDPLTPGEIPRVLYIAAEGSYGFLDRIEAWEKKHGLAVGPGFMMIEETINFMKAEDVVRLKNTVRANGGRFDLVVVDTVSRALPGADENLQKDMTLFVAACEVVKRETGGAVMGLHHAGKSGDMRGSTVLLGAGDFVFRIDRKAGATVGSLVCEKQKEAPDGWEEAYAFERVALPETAQGRERSSLVPVRCFESIGPEGRITPALSASILRAIDDAWRAGAPWSLAPQSKRFFARYAAEEFGLKVQQAEELVTMWVSMGVVIEDTADRKRRIKGLKVVGGAGQVVQNDGIFG